MTMTIASAAMRKIRAITVATEHPISVGHSKKEVAYLYTGKDLSVVDHFYVPLESTYLVVH